MKVIDDNHITNFTVAELFIPYALARKLVFIYLLTLSCTPIVYYGDT